VPQMLAGAIEHHHADLAGTIDVALSIDLHAISDGSLVGEDPAVVECAIGGDIEGTDVTALGVVDIESLFVRRVRTAKEKYAGAQVRRATTPMSA
jgi:hypothetical protein